MTNVVDITRITTNGIYVCQEGHSLVKRYSMDGKIYRFADVEGVASCIHFSNRKQIYVSTYEESLYTHIMEFNVNGMFV